MENAVDALKMAGSVLLFVLALSVVIPLLSQAKTTSDRIMSYVDRETDYVSADFFYNGKDTNKSRTVGIETVIPALYRTFKENFKVVFLKNTGDSLDFYEFQNSTGAYVYCNKIDIEEKNIGVPAGEEKEFIDGLLYHKFKPNNLLDSNPQRAFEKHYNVKVGAKSLYELLNTKKMTEDIGVYYQEDLTDEGRGKPESNKNEKRVITFQLQEP